MRTVFSFQMVSLDGFFEGPSRELDWHNVDEEFHKFAGHQLSTVDTLLFGRVTYQMLAAYWPAAAESDPMIAGRMNSLPKLVFSRTLRSVEWNNSRLMKENLVEEVSKLKNQPGKDIALLGSASLLTTLMDANLVDEHRIMIAPIVLGSGNPLFRELERRQGLKMLRSTAFKSGNVLLVYAPITN